MRPSVWAPAVMNHGYTVSYPDSWFCTPPTRGPSPCPAPPRRHPSHGFADIGDHTLFCMDKPALDNLDMVQTLSPDLPLAVEAADMHKLIMHSSPVSSASELLSRLRQVPINDQHSSPAHHHHMPFQTAPAFTVPQLPQLWPALNCAKWSAPTANSPYGTVNLPNLGQVQTERCADVCSRDSHVMEMRHDFQVVPECDCLPHDAHSQQEQLQFRAAAPVGMVEKSRVESAEDLAIVPSGESF